VFENVVQGIFSAAFLASILRVTTPILLPSLGALISDKAGVINIGLEGMMLAAAFTGVVFSAYAQIWYGPEVGRQIGPWLGLIMGTLVAVMLALVLAYFHLNLRGDLILCAIAINILGSAATVAILFELTGDRGSTSSLASLRMPFIQLPTFINDIPLVGSFIYGVFNNQNIMTWVAFLAVPVVAYVMYRTPFGMHLRAVGENPEAAASVGIPVKRIQYFALALSGMFAGFGGVHMAMGYLQLFQRDMTAGRGFIALATPLLGGGTPTGTGLASLVFGFFDALAIRIGTLAIPAQLTQMVPYVATVMALVVYALQLKLTMRVRALRAVEGAGFNVGYWRMVRQLSLLHMLLMMVAIVGALICVTMFSAPDGFGGSATALPMALMIGFVSLLIIGASVPFVIRVENITHYGWASAVVATLSLGVFLSLFLSLFFANILAVGFGLGLGFAVWLVLGGWRLLRPAQQLSATPAGD
jgi:general nucleoside transport system permease protein